MHDTIKQCLLLGAASILLGTVTHAQTTSDNFNDNSRDESIWNAPELFDGNGTVIERNQRLEFSSTASAENGMGQSLADYPTYSEAWQVQAIVSMDDANFSSPGEIGTVGIEIGGPGPGETWVEIGYGAGVIPDATGTRAVYGSWADNSNPEGETDIQFLDLPEAIGIRVTYDPDLHLFRTYYDLDTDQTDGEWTLLKSYTIDDVFREGAHKLKWEMSQFDAFWVQLSSYSENAGVAEGTAWADDFEFNLGNTEQYVPGLLFADDFNDDTLKPNTGWNDPFTLSGSPTLEDVNNRLEFTAPASSGEQERRIMVNGEMEPAYDQAFEIKVEAHILPSALSVQDRATGLDLVVANGDGIEIGPNILFSVAALFDEGTVKQVLASDDSEVEPDTDWPENLVFGTLPEVVGVRVTWNPDKRILGCYFDTDGDRTVETWDLFADYTLDGFDRGTAFTTDWQMTSAERFSIGINGFSDSTAVASGEAYFDNFSLTIESTTTPTGYEQWASEIPDESMRATAVDASGNGIQNLLQYVYGLPPMSVDTGVQLRIVVENAQPTLIHGVNPDATDYVIAYEWKSLLDDPLWQSIATGATDTFQSGGKWFQKTAVPPGVSTSFFRLAVEPVAP